MSKIMNILIKVQLLHEQVCRNEMGTMLPKENKNHVLEMGNRWVECIGNKFAQLGKRQQEMLNEICDVVGRERRDNKNEKLRYTART